VKHSTEFAVTVAEEPADDILVSDAAPAERRPLETLPTIGHIGRYALKYRLGEGGIGTVYAAHDPLLSRAVAVKTLHVDVDDDGAEAMLLHEARAAALLSHTHIVTVHDAGVSGGSVYLAMEMLQGRDLRALLARGWRPPVRQAALIVRRIAEALAYAHGKGVVHCDIKPANIFMVGRTSPKVLDFGIARVAQRPDLDTRSLAAGSPYYMAPEQVRGDAVDRRCDVYSLGVVLYELLTGRRAHSGATLHEITDAVMYRVAAPANAIDPRVPQALAAIAARAMAKDVEERHRSARQLARELRVWLGEEIPRRRRRKALMSWRGAGLALAGVGVAAVGLLAWQASAPDREPAVGVAADRAAPPNAMVVQAVAAPPNALVMQPVAAAPIALPMPVATVPLPSPAVAHGPPEPGAEPFADTVVAAGPTGPRTKPSKARKAVPPTGTTGTTAAPAAPAATRGVLQLAVSPWGEVEIDGAPAGIAPPLSRLDLTAGRHTVVIRNADFPPHTATVEVSADTPAVVRHRFGS
jgi:hypothetical protein